MRTLSNLLCLLVITGGFLSAQSRFTSSLLSQLDEGEPASRIDLDGEWGDSRFSFHWEEKSRHWNLTARTPYFLAGPLSLEGLYNLMESPSFLSSGFIADRGSICLNKDAHLPDRGGLALFNEKGSLIFHALYGPEAANGGVLWQGGGETFPRSTLGVFLSRDLKPVDAGESWYAIDSGRTDTPLGAGLVKISLPREVDGSPWTITGAGGLVLSPLLLPGYAGFLYLEGRFPSLTLGIDLRECGGHWRTIRGEPSQWSEGAALDLTLLPGGRITLAGEGSLYRPGVFQTPPGESPRDQPILWNLEGKITGGPLFLKGEVPSSRMVLGFSGTRGKWKGSGEIRRIWDGEDRGNMGFTAETSFLLSPISLEAKIRMDWLSEGEPRSGEGYWELGGKGSWKNGGVLEVRIRGEGDDPFPQGQTLSLGISFRSGNL